MRKTPAAKTAGATGATARGYCEFVALEKARAIVIGNPAWPATVQSVGGRVDNQVANRLPHKLAAHS